jgi:hypothetical protein
MYGLEHFDKPMPVTGSPSVATLVWRTEKTS